MKIKIFAAALLLVLLVSACCLVQIFGLKRQVFTLQNQMDNQYSNLDNAVAGMASAVRLQLEEQASLLSESKFDYGALDAKSMTVPISCSITPKEFSPEQTSATLSFGDQRVPMTIENGAFVASFSLPVFSSLENAKVALLENGTLRTQALDWVFSPRYEILPEVSAGFSGSISGREQVEVQGEITLSIVEQSERAEIRSVELVVALDEKEISRKALDAALVNANEFYSSFQRSTSYPMKESYAVPSGSVLTVWLEVVDQHDLHYRLPAYRWQLEQEGNPAPRPDWGGLSEETQIYSADGTLLF